MLRYPVMKPYYLLFLLFFTAACRKPVNVVSYSCKVPAIVLQQEGFTATEWDTIITTVYEPDFQYPIASDTFITTDITNELLVTPDIHSPKDFSIYLPSVNRVFLIYDIGFFTHYQQAPEGQQPDCYHDVSLTMNSEGFYNLKTTTGKVYIQLKK